jgi:hypothetical protein
VAALEALEAGDVRAATVLLLDAIEEPEDEPERRLYVCDHCGNAYPWPGLLDRHRLLSRCRERLPGTPSI